MTDRYPFEPLENRLVEILTDVSVESGGGGRHYPGASNVRIARLLDVAPRTVADWRRRGLTAASCDKAAGAINEHPWLLWPELDDSWQRERVCHEQDCEVVFWPVRQAHRFCSKRCKDRAWKRSNRERANEHARKWHQTHREAHLERCRRYDREVREAKLRRAEQVAA